MHEIIKHVHRHRQDIVKDYFEITIKGISNHQMFFFGNPNIWKGLVN